MVSGVNILTVAKESHVVSVVNLFTVAKESYTYVISGANVLIF